MNKTSDRSTIMDHSTCWNEWNNISLHTYKWM